MFLLTSSPLQAYITMAPRYEICAGLDKGHKTTPNAPKKRPARGKGRQTNHNRFVRDLVREVVGYSPYERRAMELLRISKDKRCVQMRSRTVLFPHAKGKTNRN